jgi:hypothetical protein
MAMTTIRPSTLKHKVRGLSETFTVEHASAELRIRVIRERVAALEPVQVFIQASGEFLADRQDIWHRIIHHGSVLLFRARYAPQRFSPGSFEVVFVAERSWRIRWGQPSHD